MGWVKWDNDDELTVGDDGWDIMGGAIKELEELYKKTWGRKPFLEEIIETFLFCVTPRDFKAKLRTHITHVLTAEWKDPTLYQKLVDKEEVQMFLEDKHADLRIETGSSREIWWITGDCITALTDCPGNYPQTVIHTMSFENAVEQCKLLISEGWGIVFDSPEFRKLAGWED